MANKRVGRSPIGKPVEVHVTPEQKAWLDSKAQPHKRSAFIRSLIAAAMESEVRRA